MLMLKIVAAPVLVDYYFVQHCNLEHILDNMRKEKGCNKTETKRCISMLREEQEHKHHHKKD
jgi:hypothetical protein